MATSVSTRFRRSITLLVRLDISIAILIAAALFMWMVWR